MFKTPSFQCFCSSVSHLEGVHICINAFFFSTDVNIHASIFIFLTFSTVLRSLGRFSDLIVLRVKTQSGLNFLKKNRLRFNAIDHIKENMEINLMEKCMAIIERSSLE